MLASSSNEVFNMYPSYNFALQNYQFWVAQRVREEVEKNEFT